MISRADVERVLDSTPAKEGVTVVSADGRLLADRPALPGGHAAIVVLDAEPFAYPDSGEAPCDARRRP